MQKTTLFCCCVMILFRNGYSQQSHSVLKKSLEALEKVNAATYYFTESVAPAIDTSKFKSYRRFYREVANPSDRTIGSAFAWFNSADTSKIEFFYTGEAKGYVNWNTKSIRIDSFYTNQKPFRAVGPPFFNYTKSIITYALETRDSIHLRVSDIGENIIVRLTIVDQVVEFFGNDLYYTDLNALPYVDDPDNVRSEYTIWIRKSDYLPFRFKRKMPHNVSVGEYAELKTTQQKLKFEPRHYLPADFAIQSLSQKEKVLEHKQKLLLGKVAPTFSLMDTSDDTVSLHVQKGKVVILYFTGVGCGPCHASLPFLKDLHKTSSQDIEIISVESWKTSAEGVKKYKTTNDLNFPLLAGNVKVLEDYVITSVPTFFILDKHSVVRKIITGYRKSISDLEITNEIQKLLME